MFTEALFTIVKTWKQPKCPPTDKLIKKMWYIYTMEYNSAIKKNKIMSFAATWMDLEIIILNEISQRKTNIIWYHLSVQFSHSVMFDCNPMDGSTSAFPVHHRLPEFTQTHAHWVSDAIQPSHLLSSPSPHAFNLSQHQGLFKWVSSSHQVAKVLELQLQHPSAKEILPMNIQDWSPLGWTGWISLPTKGLSSLLQHHSSKASILQHSTFFIVLLSHPYMTTVKTIALTRQTFAGKVMSLLFNKLSRLVITFLPRSKHLLISWMQSPSAVILEPP